jgi:hypothetical protein
MSLSARTDSNIRVVGHPIVHPKVQLHNLTNALQKLEAEDSKGWFDCALRH